MSYMSYDYFTRKQCNLLYKLFKQGKLVPPKDGRGKVKHPGFVYRYEGCSRYCGFNVSINEQLFNCQIAALREVISCVFKDEFEEAQSILAGTNNLFNYNWLPDSIPAKKMWKQV